ncbi:antiterminator LoaP [Shouchella lonarensis]|uniref:Transcription termination/antitermination protein NusG n=1 Tax=Shouchella lonarensis TaxID=1464122 RepID=A0A1G6M7E8_9BACI|nr:antiterminator LoaP [Shouchella lonarensis]SDC51492.1 transcriptional antiterminator NusG [Shouchella lonarensis]
MESLWYALYVRSGREEQARCLIGKYLSEHIKQILIPRRKMWERRQGIRHEVIKKLFPGYLLLQTRMNIDLYNRLKATPGCFHLLNTRRYHLDYDAQDAANVMTQSECFSAIPAKEMELLLGLTREGENIGVSEIYIENARVAVRSGPLKGFEGLIKRVNKRKKRAKVVFTFMGNNQEMDMSVEILSVMSEVAH